MNTSELISTILGQPLHSFPIAFFDPIGAQQTVNFRCLYSNISFKFHRVLQHNEAIVWLDNDDKLQPDDHPVTIVNVYCCMGPCCSDLNPASVLFKVWP